MKGEKGERTFSVIGESDFGRCGLSEPTDFKKCRTDEIMDA